jgi:hypothetical protein
VGIGMQRVWAVSVSIMCVNFVGMRGGWLSMIGWDVAGSTTTAAEPVRLDPVVVTGTQVAVPVSELPSAVTVIDRDEIESRQITDVPQLLRTVPGLSVTQTGSRGGDTAVFRVGGTRLQSGKFPHRQSVCRRQPPPQTRGVPELGNRPGSTVVRRSGSIGISLNPGHLG